MSPKTPSPSAPNPPTWTAKLYWRVQVYLCRRFIENMTVDKVAVMSYVTGVEPASILALHPRCRARKEVHGVVS